MTADDAQAGSVAVLAKTACTVVINGPTGSIDQAAAAGAVARIQGDLEDMRK
jgi:hypothetical protein